MREKANSGHRSVGVNSENYLQGNLFLLETTDGCKADPRRGNITQLS